MTMQKGGIGCRSKSLLLAVPLQILRSWSQGCLWGKLEHSPTIRGQSQVIRSPFLKTLGPDQNTELIVHGPQAAIKGPMDIP